MRVLRVLLLLGAMGCEEGGGGGQTATETNVQPASCMRDDDCPPGIACRFLALDGGSEDAGVAGFCAVGE
ncbi:MAG: hypothetical protein IT379_38975 [Deltaproteobacteria bacterium]|nr:hypothetical protein [Deltaproteobacteria bacterium]